jgi:mRNA interferase RelE/StbE
LGYKINFKRSVSKDLKRIDKKYARIILEKIEKDLPNTAANLPELQGQFAGLRKYRIGNYRVIFIIINDEILILRIEHRKGVYKK